MILFPAIDIKNGQVVRLAQGQFDQVTIYGQDPGVMAKYWETQGAEWLHVIDLDGAQSGVMANLEYIAGIIRQVKIPVQVGGGIRSREAIEKLMQAGAERVVLGTRAVEDRDFLKDVLEQWPEQIVVSLDCKDGFVTTHGWVHPTTTKATDFIKSLEVLGLRYLVYTDVATDGMLTGPNVPALEELLKVTGLHLIASGGVSSLDDLKKLLKLKKSGLIGAIVGKAIYEKKFTIKEANDLVRSS